MNAILIAASRDAKVNKELIEIDGCRQDYFSVTAKADYEKDKK
jgi:hypothetical protein